jgi:hypothetical protein
VIVPVTSADSTMTRPSHLPRGCCGMRICCTVSLPPVTTYPSRDEHGIERIGRRVPSRPGH